MKRFVLPALLTVCALIVSCQDTKSNVSEQTTSDSTTASAVTEKEPAFHLPDMDFGGEEVTFLLRMTGNEWSADDVIPSDALVGDTINDAVAARNMAVEEAFHVKIKGIEGEASLYNAVASAVNAGDKTYDVIASDLFDAASFMQNNMIVDLHSTNYLQLDQPWWNPYYSKSVSFMGHQYFALGDISRVYKTGVRCFFFNKDLAEQLDLGDIYQTVKDGSWTYETMFSLASKANADLDGNGKMDDADRYGLQAQSSLGIVLSIGGDMRITDKTDDDIPYLSVDSAYNIRVMEHVMELMQTNKASLHNCDVWLETQKRFSGGQALFQAEVMLLIEVLRYSETNIGILPTPKYSEEQAQYVSYLDSNCQNVYSIPTTNDRLDVTSFVLEAMAEKSVDTLTPAYYDICLNGKYIRDEESSDMLNIIFNGCRIENAETFWWGNMFNTLNTAIIRNQGIASTVEKRKKATVSDIEKFVDTMKEHLAQNT